MHLDDMEANLANSMNLIPLLSIIMKIKFSSQTIVIAGYRFLAHMENFLLQ